jgi:hypothetical protein
MLLPACEASMLHEPAAMNVTVLPDTAHTAGFTEAKLTARVELAVAVKYSGVPTF